MSRARARYLVRFDDICPTMNWERWDRIEERLIEHAVKPILAVVPDNRDPELVVSPPCPDFWERVRGWQRRGWSIGLHGYQHRYVTEHRGVVGLNACSEFAGRSEEEQARSLDAALAVMGQERVVPDCFVAPAHSFDDTTLALLRSRDVRVVSDGFFYRPVQWHGCLWVPQQLWRFRRMPFGLWTICFHPNRMSDLDCRQLLADIVRCRDEMMSLDEVVSMRAPQVRALDLLASRAWLAAVRIKRAAGRG